MPFTNEQKKHIQIWFDNYWPQTKKCPVCGVSQWVAEDRFFRLKSHPIEEFTNKYVMFYVIITCDNCGYTIHINTKKMGLTLIKSPDHNVVIGVDKKEENNDG